MIQASFSFAAYCFYGRTKDLLNLIEISGNKFHDSSKCFTWNIQVDIPNPHLLLIRGWTIALQPIIFTYIFLWYNQFLHSLLIVFSSQADIRNPLSLLAHNRISAPHRIGRSLYPSWYKQVPTHFSLLFAIEAWNLLGSLKQMGFLF